MALIGNTYGKGRVRVMRVHRDGDRHEVRELSVLRWCEGDFASTYTHADNSMALCTDTMKNLVNIVAHENPAAGKEDFCAAVADRLLAKYPQISIDERHGARNEVEPADGRRQAAPAQLRARQQRQAVRHRLRLRGSRSCESGVSGFTFLKATQSGWDKYYKDDYTTLKETRDRLCATSMEATWRWQRNPASFETANARVLDSMLEVFATTYSESVQDSLYRMATAALEAVPEVSDDPSGLPQQALHPDRPLAVRAGQPQPGVPADRRAARPDRMRSRPRLSHEPRTATTLDELNAIDAAGLRHVARRHLRARALGCRRDGAPPAVRHRQRPARRPDAHGAAEATGDLLAFLNAPPRARRQGRQGRRGHGRVGAGAGRPWRRVARRRRGARRSRR